MRGWLLWMLALLALPSWAAHGLGMGYEPKYPASFTHFDYVNPSAPKGGDLTLSAAGGFDKLNPFTLRGVPPVGMGYSANGFVFSEYGLLFDSLTTPSEDEPFSQYGLLAEDIQLAPDRLSVTFRLNPKARFSDGSPVLAQDVKYSFDTLRSKAAGPTFRSYWADIKEAVVTGERTIRFDFVRQNAELHMIIGGLPVFSRAWGKGKPFDQIVTEPPIASGPYVVDKVDYGKFISYRRRPDYWAANLPVRKGMFNYDTVSYQYFKDALGEEESLKAGALDAMEERSIIAWVRRYKGRRFDSGELVKEEIDHRRFTGMQGLAPNLRQPRFADMRVRRALALAFDFDWLNAHLFYGRRGRTQSYFQNSDDLMAQPVISAEEQALIDKLKNRQRYIDNTKGELPRPDSSGDTADGLRRNLVKAQALLKDAGWTYRDGALRDKAGAPFVITIDIADRSSNVVLAPYARNLGKLGIRLEYRLRDPSLLKKKLDDFDFDMAISLVGGSSSPGNELYDDFGSKSASEKGSQNLSGISDPVVDEIVEVIVNSHDRASLAAAARLLDRYLLHQHYMTPMYYGKQYFIAHKRKLRRPDAPLPQRLLAGSAMLTMWWIDPSAK
ncbi:extracellular solute-binding protein [Variovorax sp. Root473]|uniref:extracellular solute-binding protein n=1 Tax=Variovorax sp. Root473 TaxID=1736541 RepID=UPI000700CB7C|nr:extracellular solute-binding protein [Variovorax sp. Root473]KQX87527.1 oligopeptide ABC transporter periplasmic substrate-binding protein [Variovorax sp. Root473]